MAILVVGALIVAYVILAIVVARFCGVNRGWEEAVDEIPDEFPFVREQMGGVVRRPAASET